VAVEKLHHQKMLGKTLQQEAPQTTFSVFLDIFHPPIFGCFAENGLFQHPRPIASAVEFSGMARRPDRPEAEMLSEENLNELRRNLAHLSLPAVPRLPTDLQPIAHSEADANAGSGVETVVEVALILSWRESQHRLKSGGFFSVIFAT
jgi:hypothetical protein